MKSALPVFTLGVCLTVLGSLSVSAQSATPPAEGTAPVGVDAAATEIRTKLPFVSRAPVYNGIPMEYRLAAIRGPKAEKIVEDLIGFGHSDFGSLILSKKEQLPAKLRTEPGNTCSVCAVERGVGRRNLEYYVFWLRNLNAKQRQQLVQALETE
ncbi:hypothetical protein [Gloeobacter morelensis]|uniref:Uncharacterized protein n=1 Tax=Gloeobacter morelensis MG652769 TaxID=2781736 RepID=A0ABY3PN39_9CYAN|nr:hypothetical protein [Gloeobacter morelensis]UFP95035.1 hypothetical protein ISF26_01945 [Gloeobacter morelensis MG652769]